MAHTVKAVAEMAGISVRTLHYYDEIGLLRPTQVSPAGYRLYTEQDLERLQQVLFFRELGLPLQRIKEVLDRPDFDRKQALLEHRSLLLQRQERLGRLIQTIDRTLDAMERGISMEEKELFDGFDPSQYEEEVRERWGHTEAYRESAQRTRKYTKADWQAIQEEGGQILQAIADRMDRGPSDPEVQEWVGRYRQMITDRFYTCTTEIFRGLGEMYVADERFTAFFEKIRPGLASFMQAAIQVYCDRAEGQA